MANRYDIIRIDFQASAKGANTAIESIRQEAEQCNNKISELKKNIAEAPKNGTDAKILEGWNAELKLTERRFKQFNTAYKELVKGMRALDEGVKMFNDGSLSQMNAAFQKTVNNAAKLAQSKLQTGSNEWRQMGALMQETEQNYARMQRDTDQLIESLKNGGTVFRKTLDDEIKGLQDLMRILPYMGTEYRKAEEQMKFLVKTSDELIIKERQMQGEIVTTNDARRVSYQLTKEGAEAARQRAAAADEEIEKGKQIIANLEAEQKTREDNARVSAQAAAEYRQNQKMHEDEIERLDAEMKKEMELANSKKNGVEALKQKALGLQDEAETEKKKQQELDGVRDTAREKVEKLRQEYEALKQSVGSAPAKDPVSEAVKAGAEEVVEVVKKEAEETKKKTTAKNEENQAVKETTETKKEEVKVEEKVAETQKTESFTIEELTKKASALRSETLALLEERKQLEVTQSSGIKTIKKETSAVEKEANAFANLTKEQAEAMLKQKQALATITKGAEHKFAYTNAEEAQYFLIESMRQANPANAKGNTLSLDKEGVAKVKGMFMERYGIQDDTDAMYAMRGLLSGNHGRLVDMGMINDAFSRVDLNPLKIASYTKEIKDLTAIINGETEATKDGTKAVEENEKAKRTLADVDEEYEAKAKQIREIMKVIRQMQDAGVDSTDKLAEKTKELAESHEENAEAINKEVQSTKELSKEQAEAMLKAMQTPSKLEWKGGKLNASNLEQVQSYIIAKAKKLNPDYIEVNGSEEKLVKGMKDGTIQVGHNQTVPGYNSQLQKLFNAFKKDYGLEGSDAKDIFKEIVTGGGGLFKKGGVVDFSTGEMTIPYDQKAQADRVAILKELVAIKNKDAQATQKQTEATQKQTEATQKDTETTNVQTDAIKKQKEEVARRKEAFNKANSDYEEKNNKLKDMRMALGRMPKSGTDALLARQQAQDEIDEYNENVVKPARADKTKLKGLWEKSAKDLLRMQSQDTEETQKNTDAQNQNTEATENNTKSKGRKKKAAEETAKATGEETQKSAELLAKEKELEQAEKDLETANKNAEAQQKKTTKAVEEAEAAVTKADDADKKHVETMDKLADEQQQHKKDLQELNEANKDTIATNEKNQQLLAETNNKILEQGEKIRDAERIKAQAKTDGIEKTEQAIRLLTEENRHIDQNSFTWKRNTIEIQHLQEALDEMKNKPVLMMMEQRMKNVGALSASAVTETKRFWEAMVAGAEKGSEKLREAEIHLAAITEEEQKRKYESLERKVQALSTEDLGVYSIDELREGIEAAKELQRNFRLSDEEIKQLSESIVQAEKRINEVSVETARAAEKQREQISLMEEQLSKGDALTESALEAQVQYWQRLADDPKMAADAVERYTANLKEAQRLIDQHNAAENERKAQIVSSGGSLNVYSESEITEAIKAAKELHSHMASASPEAQKLADSIANAEAHIKQYGIEAARTAQRQKEMDDTMRKQFQTMTDEMSKGVLPSQSVVKAQMNYWQRLIDDPKTAKESLKEYRDQLDEVQKMYDAMVKVNGQTAFEWFRSGMDKDASDDKIKDMAGKLKEYRGTLLHETNAEEIQKIDEYLQRVGASAKKAGEELMDFEKAKELALQAGDDVYGKKNPAFLASPEEIKAATKSIENYRENLFKTIKAKKDMGEATDEEEAELKELAKYLKDLKFEQDNFNMSREKMEQLMDTPVNATSIDELREAIKRADAELKRMEGSLGKNNKEYQAFADKVRNAKNTLKEMEGAAKASATAWEKAWSRLKTYVVMYMGFNAVWQKMMGTADDLMQLSDKMGEVRKTTSFTADEVGRLSDNLAKLDTRTSLTGLMEFSSLAGSIGLKTQEDVQGFTEAANMLSVSLPEMGNEASRTLMKIADATGDLEKNGGNVRETLERVGSTIIALRANSAAAAGPITDFVSRVGAVGAQAGISIDQIAALGATVDALGGRVEMSATALSRMIPAIKNNTFEVAKAIGMTEKELKNMTGMEQMVAIFRKLHDSAKGFDTSTEEGMNAMADSVEKALGRSASMQEVMKELNQQGARAGIVFGLLSQNVDTLEEQLDTASEAYSKNIALMNEYNRMNETTAAKWERLKNQLEEAFVSDYMQRFLGGIIDTLRYLVDFITGNVTGVFKSLNTALFTLAAGFVAFKSGIGAALVSLGGLSKALSNFRALITLAIGDMGRYIQQLWLSKFALDEEARAAARAKLATMGATKAMMANVVMAFIAAIAMLAWKLYNMAQAAKEAGREAAKFQSELEKEQKKVDDLSNSIGKARAEMQDADSEIKNAKKSLEEAKKATTETAYSADKLKKSEEELREAEEKKSKAMREAKKLIAEFNTQYSKYLGFMLSEVSSNYELANARELVNSKLRETITLKRKEAALERVENNLGEDRDEAYASLYQSVHYLSTTKNEQGKEIKDPTRAAKALNAITKAAQDASKDRDSFEKAVENILRENRIPSRGTSIIRYALSYFDEVKEIQEKTQQIEKQFAAEEEVNRGQSQTNLVNQVNAGFKNYNSILKKYQESKGSERAQAAADLLKQMDTMTGMRDAAEKYYDMSNPDEVKAYGKRFNQLISWKGYNRDELLKVAGNLYTPGENGGNGGGGGGTTNPYGDYNKVTSPYSQWNGDDLVARRKEMLERVRALANGADVQKVLSEDAKFITEATRKNIKTTEQAIEWYNAERLKIQDALHEKHLTNTGDWLDPKKGGKKASKMVQDEMKYYLDELDAYYTERKTKIQEARNDEAISEAEAWNRDIKNEAEWYRRRAELQQLYAKQSEKVTQDELDAIFNILSERTDDSVDYIKKDIDHTVKFIEKVGKEKGKPAMDRIIGDIDLGIEKAFLKQRNTLGKHLKAIEDIVNKERPFSGIAKNLQDNLGKMGILTADMAEGADSAAEELKRITFLLGESENAYTMTVDKLLEDMRQNGFKEWADVISKDPSMQQGLLAMLRQTFDAVQDAIKKESSIIKKQVEIMMQDITEQAQADTTHLQILQNSVERANSLIGAGTASERVADKLAMKQMRVQINLQETRMRMLKKAGADRVALLQQEADLLDKQGKKEEAKQKRMDAENVEKSVGLTLTKEQVELDKQRISLAEKLEESQNRLYTELKEWGDLLYSSMKDIFEASHAGDAEYYNERAKMNLTGNGGPGAGTYIVIDNEGTEDAAAHYEYLDERQALERQREIERENAQAEAWRKVWDDLNQKMSETITDQLNAALQNMSIDANTNALGVNTAALGALSAQLAQGITINKGGDRGVVEIDNPTAAQPGAPETPAPFTEEGFAMSQETSWINGADYMAEAEAKKEISNSVLETFIANKKKEVDTETQGDKKIQTSTQSTFAKMTLAANMYGAAYQAMSNENLSTTEKFEMMALQAVGNYAIGALTTELAGVEAKAASDSPGVLGTLWKQLGWAAAPVFAIFTGLLGGLMGLASSKIGKAKSTIAQATGASVNAGRLATGMMTYAEGNVNEFTDPGSLKEGRQYNVDGADGRTYRARYMGKGAKTHITNGPEFHLVGERGREAIIDAHTTRNIQLNEPEIWRSIQTLYNGGSLRHSTRRGHGMAAYAEGNLDEFEMSDAGGMMAEGGFSPEMMTQMQAALDRNSAVMETIVSKGIKAYFDVYGKGGLVDSYDTGKKTVKRHGERY